jgi:hypothetical protein
MAAPAKPRSRFGEQLREQLDRHPRIKSVRQLAREMAPDRPEPMRRMLQKWIAGVKPTVARRYHVATALGIDASAFSDGAEDDEEEAELNDLIRALMHQVGVVVDRKLEERLSREESDVSI